MQNGAHEKHVPVLKVEEYKLREKESCSVLCGSFLCICRVRSTHADCGGVARRQGTNTKNNKNISNINKNILTNDSDGSIIQLSSTSWSKAVA